MNYIELINHFWRLNKEYAFTPHETQLYFKLLDTCNSLGWKNPFNQSNRFICGEIGISEPTLIRARNRLKQVGLIDFTSDKGRRNITLYEIKTSTSFSINGSISNSINGSISDTSALVNNKHKPKGTKPKISTFVAPTLKDITEYYVNKEKLSIEQADTLAVRFITFYESKDWMIGRNRMTNWQAAATRAMTWIADAKSTTPARPSLHSNSKDYTDF